MAGHASSNENAMVRRRPHSRRSEIPPHQPKTPAKAAWLTGPRPPRMRAIDAAAQVAMTTARVRRRAAKTATTNAANTWKRLPEARIRPAASRATTRAAVIAASATSAASSGSERRLVATFGAAKVRSRSVSLGVCPVRLMRRRSCPGVCGYGSR